MVQQNIVSYIISQIRQGKKLQEINDFLVSAGYDKQEVESSVQYVINTEKNPEIAEQQRIQQLAGYITSQVQRGYDQHVIVNFLIQKGYPYYEVNSAINMLKAPPAEAKIEHKLGLLALVTIIMVAVGVGIFYFSAVLSPAAPAKLLDVTTNKLTTLAKPGEDLSFQVNLVNLGDIQRYDVVLDYEILERDSGRVVSKSTETVAISTSTQRVVSLPIPSGSSPGKYLLKAVASYEQFNATSGFLFEILPEAETQVIEEEIEALVPEEVKQPVTPIQPEPVVPVAVPEIPAVTPTAPVQEVSLPKTEEELFLSKSKAEAIEYVKAVSVRDAPKAISLCKAFTYDSQQAQCLSELASYRQEVAFCLSINDTVRKDSCVLQTVMLTKRFDDCSKIADPNIRQSCDMFSAAEAAKNKYLTPEQKAGLPVIDFNLY